MQLLDHLDEYILAHDALSWAGGEQDVHVLLNVDSACALSKSIAPPCQGYQLGAQGAPGNGVTRPWEILGVRIIA